MLPLSRYQWKNSSSFFLSKEIFPFVCSTGKAAQGLIVDPGSEGIPYTAVYWRTCNKVGMDNKSLAFLLNLNSCILKEQLQYETVSNAQGAWPASLCFIKPEFG